MIEWGVTAGAHDASVTVVKGDEILFAGHAERYSRKKNDAFLNHGLIEDALQFGMPRQITWYENTMLKRMRQLWAGQYKTAFTKPSPARQLLDVGLITRDWSAGDDNVDFTDEIRLTYESHHKTHAAAGYYTSKYTDAAVLVVDSIGEFETLTIWHGQGNKLKKKFSQSYPNSLGLWYSAMTQRIGLKPQEDEYILMGWAAVGDPERFKKKIFEDFFHPLDASPRIRFKDNLHRGCLGWAPELNTVQDYADIAAGTQAVYEMVFEHLVQRTQHLVSSPNLVVMGGCALNCVANSIAYKYYNGNVHIMPNPGDAGSSLGAVLANRKRHINWTGPYLGHNIEGDYPVKKALAELKTKRVCGVANGRAEFGPRALGNRSLFADPRGPDIKDLVNTVKRRQEFRPFAPVVLEQYADKYFDGPVGPYMQYTSVCKRPDLFPAIAHLDNTSRVQTVNEKEHPGLYKLLTEWHKATGCPIILNTSLNIKGEPIVNTLEDANRWQQTYNVKVFTND